MLTRAVGAWVLVGLSVIAARIWWSVAAAIAVFVVTPSAAASDHRQQRGGTEGAPDYALRLRPQAQRTTPSAGQRRQGAVPVRHRSRLRRRAVRPTEACLCRSAILHDAARALVSAIGRTPKVRTERWCRRRLASIAAVCGSPRASVLHARRCRPAMTHCNSIVSSVASLPSKDGMSRSGPISATSAARRRGFRREEAAGVALPHSPLWETLINEPARHRRHPPVHL
jgi:hypothetical protein